MALFRKFFYRKPPDGLLEISERVYVFDCCFTMEIVENTEYMTYIGSVVGQLRHHSPDASFMGFNFGEDHPSQISNILCGFDMTVMDYPRQYEGCPLLSMEMIHHFLRSCESWLLLDKKNALLMHCDRGGWPVLAFMLAAMLIYTKQFNDERKTLDMIHKQAPRELLLLMSPLNFLPSQIRYLQYVSRRNVGFHWPPLDRALTLDCVILRAVPNMDGNGGCRPFFRIYGPDPFMVSDESPKVLFSAPKKINNVRLYKQEDSDLIKLDIHCHVQGDVVMECISLEDEQERELIMFRAMFNTAFIRSNILMLNQEEIEVSWDVKDQFPKDFRVEVLFSEMDSSSSLASIDLPIFEDKDALPMEAFAKVQEFFSSTNWCETKLEADAAGTTLHNLAAIQEHFEHLRSQDTKSGTKLESQVPESRSQSPRKEEAHRLESDSHDKLMDPHELQAQWMPEIQLSSSDSSCSSSQGSPLHTSSSIGITVPLNDDCSSSGTDVVQQLTSIPEPILPAGSAPPPPPLPPRLSLSSHLRPPPPPPPLCSAVEVLASVASAYSPTHQDVRPVVLSPSVVSCSASSAKPEPLVDPTGITLPPPAPPPLPPPLRSNSISSSPTGPPLPPGIHKAAKPRIPPPPPIARTTDSGDSSPVHENVYISIIESPSLPLPPPPPPPPPAPAPSAKSGIKDSAKIKSPPIPPPAPPVKRMTSGSETCSSAISGVDKIKVPSVPRPPPSAPLMTTMQSVSRSSSRNQIQPRKANLKPYHWLKLSRAMQGSIWAEAQKPDEASKAPEFDMSELESLFSAATPTSDTSGTTGKSIRKGTKPEKIQLIELRRAYNCEIMLSKVKVPLGELMNSVLAMDELALDVDQVDNLIKFCPTKEEMDLLKAYNGKIENLGRCEQFFLEMMKLPRVESKLRVFSFKLQFDNQVSDLRTNLTLVNSASEEIRSSIKLKRIMQTILSLGNALNQGTARGSAVGFKLDSLLKLTDTRARNNKMTLMHYLCKVLAEKLPELLDFPKDLNSLEPSTKIQLKYLAEEMQAINKGLDKVMQELTSSENDGPVSQIFRKTLKDFLNSAESEVRSLAQLYSSVGRNADALALYFGEDPARCSFEQVVSTLHNFVRTFVRAHDENRKQLELEKKKAEKERTILDKRI